MLVISTFSEIKTVPTTWLWQGWLAEGSLHLLAGESGTGKSGLCLDIASAITQGNILPDGVTSAPRGRVLLYASEDTDSTMKARLVAAGADLTQVATVRGVRGPDGVNRFDPAAHRNRLRAELLSSSYRLVILDPIIAFAKGQGGGAVREALEDLADIAKASHAAILGITHFAKATGKKPPLERVVSSQAFTAVPRIVLIAGVSEESGEKVVVRAKSNICETGDGFEYRIVPLTVDLDGHQAPTTKIAWGREIVGSAEEILRKGPAKASLRPLEAAQVYLVARLADGPVAVSEIMQDALANGHSEKTVKRAKTEMAIRSYWVGRVSFWRLADDSEDEFEQMTQLGHLIN